MEHPETHAVTLERGPRPAGKPDECFYCREKVGGTHKEDCVLRSKTVMVQYTVEIPITVPEDWDEEMVNFHRNESSWCSNNAVDEIVRAYRSQDKAGAGCMCKNFSSKYLREATPEDEREFGVTKFDKNDEIGDLDILRFHCVEDYVVPKPDWTKRGPYDWEFYVPDDAKKTWEFMGHAMKAFIHQMAAARTDFDIPGPDA